VAPVIRMVWNGSPARARAPLRQRTIPVTSNATAAMAIAVQPKRPSLDWPTVSVPDREGAELTGPVGVGKLSHSPTMS